MDYYDIAVRNPELSENMSDLGWETQIFDIDRNFITNTDWGKIKREVTSSDALNILQSSDPEITAKAVKLQNLDAILSPAKGRKDPGINHVIAKAAAENQTSIILSFNELLTSRKKRMHTLSNWRTIIKLADKYEFNLILSTGAEQKHHLRNPQDLEALLQTLEVEESSKPLNQNPSQLVSDYL